MKLSVVILARNEEKNLERAIRSVPFASEVIVVDDASQDKTGSVAKKHRARVFRKALNTDFGAQRNFALEKASSDWVLYLDADEEVSDALSHEIQKILLRPGRDSYFIRRRDFFWGKWLRYGEVREAYNRGFIRLVKKGSGVFRGSVHEEFIAEREAGSLSGFINHYPHPAVSDFIRRVNLYSSWRAQELKKSGKKTNIPEIVFLPFMKFVYTYFILLGFLDGPPGFVYSFIMSFHSFLTRAKLLEPRAPGA